MRSASSNGTRGSSQAVAITSSSLPVSSALRKRTMRCPGWSRTYVRLIVKHLLAVVCTGEHKPEAARRRTPRMGIARNAPKGRSRR